jgi:hypothetical protein
MPLHTKYYLIEKFIILLEVYAHYHQEEGFNHYSEYMRK